MSKKDKIKERASRDHYYFCREILGFDKMTPKPHQELCDFLETKTPRRKKMVMMPRNSFKSTVVTVGHALFSLVKNPNERILIASETQKNATKYVKEVKAQIEGNQKFRALFGQWENKNDTWRDFEFTINKRTKVSKECSITASSMEKGLQTGMHYSRIYLDDAVSKSNVNTPEQIQKTLDYYRLLLSILDPEGEIIVCGTRYSIHDLYGWIDDPENPEHENFDIFTRSAVDEDGTLLMPDVLSQKFLDEQRATQGSYIFSCQYMLRPLSDANQTFKEKWIKYYEKNPPGLIYFMTIDPAISTKTDADFTGIIVNGVDHNGAWYVQEANDLKLNIPELVEEIFRMHAKYGIMCLGMEKFALEKALRQALELEMIRRKIYIPIKEIETDTRQSKEVRIRSLQPMFERGMVFLKKEHKRLAMQIAMHPQLKHDDLIDALKSQLAITFASDYKPGDVVERDYGNLPAREAKIWNEIDKIVRRKVKETKGGYV